MSTTSKNKRKAKKRRKKQSASDIDSSKGEGHGETGSSARSDIECGQWVGNTNIHSVSETIAEGNRALYETDSFTSQSRSYTEVMSSTPLFNTQYPASAPAPATCIPQNLMKSAQNLQQNMMHPQQNQFQTQPSHMYVVPASDQPPKWALALIEDVKNIKLTLTKIDNIQQTVNSIDVKVTDLEAKVNSIDLRVRETESACSFISDQTESNKTELKTAKSNIEDLNKQCKTLNDKVKSLHEEKSGLESKLLDLECRSMQENLLFYGIREAQDEDCEKLIKQMCVDKLKIEKSMSFKIDRAHRVGPASNNKPRPIVAKFHSFQEREIVRKKSFEDDASKVLKESKQGIGIQWPKQIRDTRKELRPIMLRERERGKTVRMVKDKLYVNNRLVNKADYDNEQGTGRRNMEI